LDIIFEHGGVYLDSDVRVCKSLADIADNCDFFVCSEDGQVLTNAVFGASAGHSALGVLIEDLLSSAPDWTLPPHVTTGPEFFARVLKWRQDINVLPRAAFYPYNWNEPIQPPHPAAYGTHHWAASWKTAQAKEAEAATKDFNPRRLLSRSFSRLGDRMSRSERVLRYLSKRIDGYSCSDLLVRRTVHGQSILLSGRDLSVAPEIYMNGYYELREEMFLKKILKGGDYFVDVGANVGIFALTRPRTGKCRVVAFSSGGPLHRKTHYGEHFGRRSEGAQCHSPSLPHPARGTSRSALWRINCQTQLTAEWRQVRPHL
jgi:hypothetical protein